MAKQSSAAPKADTRRFEYASDTWRNNEAEIFLSRSTDGWELVSVTESANHERRYYFKRQI